MTFKVNNVGTVERFANKIGKCARRMNQIAARELKTDKIEFTFPKATLEDLQRLTSKKLEDSYKRVTWTNPKDGKIYHLLEENRTKEGITIRILSSEGEFIKNATIQPKTIVIFDQYKNIGGLRSLLKFRRPDFAPAHGEIVETYLRRTNPFVNIERLEQKRNIFELLKYRGILPQSLMTKRFKELNQTMENGHNVDYIAIPRSSMGDIGKYSKYPGEYQKMLMEQHGLVKEYHPLIKAFKSIMAKGARIFVSSGNDKATTINKYLAIDGVEGVGALSKGGKVASTSASRNSIFTQHYEQHHFVGHIVEEDGKKLGINITGQLGVDLPLTKKNAHLLRNIAGTSYSTPIRVAKIALNDMMEGII